MPDYSLSKIYKLVSNKSPHIYIGSCATRLSTRLSEHKCKSNRCVSKKLFTDDAIITIVLIEDYPCDSKNMLKARELHHITNNMCINANKPFVCDITFDDKKEWVRQYNNEYRSINKEVINAQKKQYYCENTNAISVRDKQYYEANKNEICTSRREYRKANADYINARRRERYAEKKLAKNLETISL